ncbi:MAG: MBL fold metallo-hydrolase [Thermodesulfobacteriota bacterium]
MSWLRNYVRERIRWLGQSGFRIEGEQSSIYIDPWQVRSPHPADLILITHSHEDHFSPVDIEKILSARPVEYGLRGVKLSRSTAVLMGPSDCEVDRDVEFQAVAPGAFRTTKGVSIRAVSAYDLDGFHPSQKGWVGYVLTLDGVSIYHCGDTRAILPMAGVSADIALVPVGGTHAMTLDEAIKAVEVVNARLAIPMLTGEPRGGSEPLYAFAEACKTPVMILPTAD